MSGKRTVCPVCGEVLMLKVPPGIERGTFSASCPTCRTVFLVEIPEEGDVKTSVIKRGSVPERHTPGKAGSSQEIKEMGLVQKGWEARTPAAYTGEKKLIKVKGRSCGGGSGLLHSRLLSLKSARIYLLLAALLFTLHFFYLLYSTTYLKGLEELHPEDIASVAINVYDNTTGRGIEGAAVVLLDEGIEVKTNSFGHVVIESVEKGKHAVEIRAPGYATVRAEIIVRVGVPNVWDFYLSAEEGQMSKEIPPSPTQKTYDLMVYSSPAAAVLAIVGFYLIGKRDFFFLAFTSSFLSMAGFGFLIGSLLSGLAAVSVALHYGEFRHLRIMMRVNVKNGLSVGVEKKAPPPPKKRGRVANRSTQGLPPPRVLSSVRREYAGDVGDSGGGDESSADEVEIHREKHGGKNPSISSSERGSGGGGPRVVRILPPSTAEGDRSFHTRDR